MKRVAIALSLLVVVVFVGSVAGYYRPLTLQQLVDGARLIVTGKVASTVLISEKNFWLTKEHAIEVVSVLKGKPDAKTVKVRTKTISPQEQMEDMPVEMPGQGTEVLLFLAPGPDGVFKPVDSFDSIWPLKDGRPVAYDRPPLEDLKAVIDHVK